MFNWRAVAEHYRIGGCGRIFEVLCGRGLVPNWFLYFYGENILRLQTLNHKVPRRRATGYEYGVAGKEDVNELVEITDDSPHPDLKIFFEAFFENGNKCFVVRKNGAIVGYSWACRSKYTISNDNYKHRQLHLLLQPNEVFFANGYIRPEFRLKGLFPELIRTALDSYSQDTSFYTSVAHLNDMSLKSLVRLGFDVILSLGCHRVGKLPYFWTVRAPDRTRQWVGWRQPAIALRDITAKHGSDKVRNTQP